MSDGLWNTTPIGTPTTGYTLSQLTNPSSTTTAPRTVTESTTTGASTVTSAGNATFSAAGSNQALGEQDFLNLLVTQLKNQDPTSPQDDTTFVSQLAQFSQLQTTQNEATNVSSLSTNMTAFMQSQNLGTASVVNASSTNLLGKTVTVANSSLTYADKPVSMNVQLNTGVTSATLVVKDSSGNVVATRAVTSDGSSQDVAGTWDGNNDNGTAEPAGTYSVSVMDSTNQNVEGYVTESGTVTGIRYSSSGSSLVINGNSYSTNNLMSVDTQS